MAESKSDQKNEQPQKETPIERVFLADDLLPNAAESLVERVESIDNAIKTGDVVLDTNVLLLPYGAGANSLKQVVGVFTKLKTEGRLFLPAQVAREFVKNRPNKLSELQQGLSDKISRYVALDKLSFPILEGVAEYNQLNQALEKSFKLKAELSKIASLLVKTIRSWEWNDPVNTAYRDVFTIDRIIEPKIERAETLAELARRQRLQIPPGYKDAAKEDLGIGDFLIWKSILELGAKNKKHIIFVSGDEKADWQHRAGGSGFLPRYELMDEYRRASGGKSFYIIQLSNLLELLEAKQESIEEIKKEEERIQEATNVIVDCPNCAAKVLCYVAEYHKSSAVPTCTVCLHKFHVHRVHGNIITRKANIPDKEEIEGDIPALEKLACPNCNAEVEGLLGTYHGATMSCKCKQCQLRFNIHRKADGGVFVGRFNPLY